MRQFFLILLLLLSPLAASGGAVKYDVDAANSKLGFIYFFGDSPIEGRFPDFQADINIDFQSVSKSELFVTLDVTKANAGLLAATGPMLSESVLNADAFPTITFQSTHIRLGAHPTVIVSGDLTIRDVTRPIDFTATLIVENAAQAAKRDRLLIRLDADFSRSAFGAGGYSDLVKDNMKLQAEIAIVRKP